MAEQRRSQERYPIFRVVEVTLDDTTRRNSTFSIMLRDVGPTGLGGVYVGQEPIEVDDILGFDDEGTPRKLRVVWKKKTAEYVDLLGFEVVE